MTTFLAGLLSLASPALAQTAPKPNIVFILIDDMGWRDVGSFGSTFYETPNIDRLAREGMKFMDAYAACPVCSPSRASILTGKYPQRVGVTDYIGGKAEGKLIPAPYLDHLPLEEKTLATALKNGGYQTWHLGKWHLGKEPYWPEHQGFDVNVGGFQAGHPSSYFSPYHNPNLPDGPAGEYLTDRLTDEAIKLIEHRDPARPFFMNFWHYSVHTPIQAPKALTEKYTEKAKRLGLDKVPAFKTGDHFHTIQKQNQFIKYRLIQSDPVYAAMIEDLDTNIGRLIAELDHLNLSKNTTVIFTSDNGGLSTAEGSPTCNSPLLNGKGWMYEGGLRVPLIVKWPGHVSEGSMTDHVVTSPDFYPTLLQAADLPPMPQQHVDGVSFLNRLVGGPLPAREAIYWHYPHYGNQGGIPTSAIRAGDWKLIEFFEDHHLELYNLKNDLSETHDLAKQEPERVNELHEKLIAWQKDVGAKMPTPNPKWK